MMPRSIDDQPGPLPGEFTRAQEALHHLRIADLESAYYAAARAAKRAAQAADAARDAWLDARGDQ